METENTAKDNVFRERTESFDQALKRKKVDSSGEAESTNNILEELKLIRNDQKLIRNDLDMLKQKTEEKSNENPEFSEIRTDIKNIRNLMAEMNDCLKSCDVKFDMQEKRIDQLEKRLDAQSTEIHSLREKLQKTEDRVVDTEHVVEKSTNSIKATQNQLKKVDEKAIDQAARSRRGNLIFHGIPETSNEDSEACKRKVKAFIKEHCKLPDNFIIEVAHRLGAARRDAVGSEADKPRPMIAKFLNRGDRDTVNRAKMEIPKDKKDKGIGITQDFPREIRMGRRRLIPKMIKAKDEGHQSYIAYPCRLFVNGREVERIDPASLST